MKIIKKILFILTFSLILCFGIRSNINAANTTTSDNGNGSWTPNETIETNLFGMQHLSVYGNGNDTKPQHINVLSMKTDGVSSKLVTWSVLEGNKNYTRQTLDVIAKDYEKNHPGWIVIGGINGDQYTTGFGSDLGAGSAYFTPQTYYPLIMDGESRIPLSISSGYTMHVGFANDGSDNSLIGASPVIGYQLIIVDEYKNEISKFDVNKINEAPGANETTAWSTHISKSNHGQYISRQVSSENEIYVVENPELAYMSDSKEYGRKDSFFGKGTISKIAYSHTLNFNQFAIETTNSELKNALAEGTRIIVEAKYESEALNKVEASTGYHSVHRYNDEDQPLVHTDYDGNRYSRAIIGRKADGTYVLLTVDVATDPNDLTIRYAGMGFDECNATLKHYGVVEAYQMDGGGSVTSILRNEKGEFDISNYTREGVRANMTGLLYVVRSPELTLSEETYHSITFDHNPTLHGINSTIQNIKIKHNDKEYTLQDSKIVIDGLEEDTEYIFECTYEVVGEDGTKQEFTTTLNGKTKIYEGTKANFSIANVNKNSFDIVKETNDNIRNVKVDTNSTEYTMQEDTLTIDGLVLDTNYVVNITYDIYDPTTGNVYSRVYPQLDVKTSLYSMPKIVSFELYRQSKNRITFMYEYEDSDDLVKAAYIYCDTTQQELVMSKGTASVSDLDFDNNYYSFYIEVLYILDGTEYSIKSEVINAGTNPNQQPVEINHSITYILDGGVLNEAPTTYIEGVGINTLPTPTKEGYIFKGWYIDNEKIESITKDDKGDITLTAKWEEELKEDPTPEPTPEPTPTPTPEPSESKKGCGCGKNAAYMIVLSSLLSLAFIIIRKRK